MKKAMLMGALVGLVQVNADIVPSKLRWFEHVSLYGLDQFRLLFNNLDCICDTGRRQRFQSPRTNVQA